MAGDDHQQARNDLPSEGGPDSSGWRAGFDAPDHVPPARTSTPFFKVKLAVALSVVVVVIVVGLYLISTDYQRYGRITEDMVEPLVGLLAMLGLVVFLVAKRIRKALIGPEK